MTKLDLLGLKDSLFEFNHSHNFSNSSLMTVSNLVRSFLTYNKLVPSKQIKIKFLRGAIHVINIE